MHIASKVGILCPGKVYLRAHYLRNRYRELHTLQVYQHSKKPKCTLPNSYFNEAIGCGSISVNSLFSPAIPQINP